MMPPLSSAASSSQPEAAATDSSSGMISAKRLGAADMFRLRSPLISVSSSLAQQKKWAGGPLLTDRFRSGASWPTYYKEGTSPWQVAAERTHGPYRSGKGRRRVAASRARQG